MTTATSDFPEATNHQDQADGLTANSLDAAQCRLASARRMKEAAEVLLRTAEEEERLALAYLNSISTDNYVERREEEMSCSVVSSRRVVGGRHNNMMMLCRGVRGRMITKMISFMSICTIVLLLQNSPTVGHTRDSYSRTNTRQMTSLMKGKDQGKRSRYHTDLQARNIFTSNTSEVDIHLQANTSLTTLVDASNYALMFQPVMPPSIMSCSEQCACPTLPGETTCECFMEMVCDGEISLDLSAGDTLNLNWEIPDGLRVQGWEGTEFEFRLSPTTECESTYQDVPHEKISFDFIDESGGVDEHTQIYSHEESESFFEIDAGCSIFTRLQFRSLLDIQFTTLKMSARYDAEKVVKGERVYNWATNSYMWMRRPEGGTIEFLGTNSTSGPEDIVSNPSTASDLFLPTSFPTYPLANNQQSPFDFTPPPTDYKYVFGPTYPPNIFGPTYPPTNQYGISELPATPVKENFCNPEECACPGLGGVDYRGSISSTWMGECKKWEDTPYTSQRYPHAGLEGNFCRNPAYNGFFRHPGYTPGTDRVGPWCETIQNSFSFCDIPICEDCSCSPSCTHSSPSFCGCAEVNQMDYRGSVSVTTDGTMCKQWDDTIFSSEHHPHAGLKGNNFCRNPINDNGGAWCVTSGDGRAENEWNYCSVPDCSESPCGYLKVACTQTLVDGKEQENNEAVSVCKEYAGACCGDDEDCKCSIFEQACHDIPGQACELATEYCCRGAGGFGVDANGGSALGVSRNCICDIYEYAESILKYTSPAKGRVCDLLLAEMESWSGADNEEENSNEDENSNGSGSGGGLTIVHMSLFSLYRNSGGESWLNSDGWITESEYSDSLAYMVCIMNSEADCDSRRGPEIKPVCQWFGIECNEDGYMIGINLANNNLTGSLLFDYAAGLSSVKSLNLANNNLASTIPYQHFQHLRNLEAIDLSNNQFTGSADCLFSPAAVSVSLRHNKLAKLSTYIRFKPSYMSLESCDLGYNEIDQDLVDILHNLPPNLKQLTLSNNLINGTFTGGFVHPHEELGFLAVDSNRITGTIPDFSRLTPRLRELNMSNQTSGLTGSIPAELSNLEDLRHIDLSHNRLSDSIPPVLGNLVQLRTMILSHNNLDGFIPKELGTSSLEVLDLSDNSLSGNIPYELALLSEAPVSLAGNALLWTPAPLSLCFVSQFDLKDDTSMCPTERNALKVFYESAKGDEWTVTDNWVDELIHQCAWYGILCSEDEVDRKVVNMTLPNNGLSGKLSASIANLSSLVVLDLSDNDIKGNIPVQLQSLTSLEVLRLSYNSLIGEVPLALGSLPNLHLVQLHSNRISGDTSHLQVQYREAYSDESSSFVADCGVPTDFDEALKCGNCTMCCNAQGDCLPTEETMIQRFGIQSYEQFIWVFFVTVVVFSVILSVGSILVDKYKRHKQSQIPSESQCGGQRPSRQTQLTNEARDRKYALEKIGKESVYHFLLSKSLTGWFFAIVVMVLQLVALSIFVSGAERDLSDDNSDLMYTWKCVRDKVDCDDKADLDWKGWFLFSILMTAYLAKDIINGSKMIVFGAKSRHSLHTRLRMSLGGILLIIVTGFALFASTIYNKAIATSNTEIIYNSVIILFVTEMDEKYLEVLVAINSDWVDQIDKQLVMKPDNNNDKDEDEESRTSTSVCTKSEEVEKLKRQLELLTERVLRMETENQQRDVAATNCGSEEKKKQMSLWDGQDWDRVSI